jgi:hypothetical protein
MKFKFNIFLNMIPFYCICYNLPSENTEINYPEIEIYIIPKTTTGV